MIACASSSGASKRLKSPEPFGHPVPTREILAQLLSLALESLIRVVLRRSGFGLRPCLSGTIP